MRIFTVLMFPVHFAGRLDLCGSAHHAWACAAPILSAATIAAAITTMFRSLRRKRPRRSQRRRTCLAPPERAAPCLELYVQIAGGKCPLGPVSALTAGAQVDTIHLQLGMLRSATTCLLGAGEERRLSGACLLLKLRGLCSSPRGESITSSITVRFLKPLGLEATFEDGSTASFSTALSMPPNARRLAKAFCRIQGASAVSPQPIGFSFFP